VRIVCLQTFAGCVSRHSGPRPLQSQCSRTRLPDTGAVRSRRLTRHARHQRNHRKRNQSCRGESSFEWSIGWKLNAPATYGGSLFRCGCLELVGLRDSRPSVAPRTRSSNRGCRSTQLRERRIRRGRRPGDCVSSDFSGSLIGPPLLKKPSSQVSSGPQNSRQVTPPPT
jgi:hypothetical protein